MADADKRDYCDVELRVGDERYLYDFLLGKPDRKLARVRVTDPCGPTKTYVEVEILGVYPVGAQQYGYRVGERLTPLTRHLT